MSPLLLHGSAFLTAACLAGLWQSVAMVLMAIVLCRWMPRASAARRHALLLALFAGTLLLPLLALRGSSHPAQHGVQVAPWVCLAVAGVWLVAAALRGAQLVVAWRHLCAVRRNAMVLESPNVDLAAGGRIATLCSSQDVDSPTILGFWSPRLLLPTWMANQISPDDLQQLALHECEHLRRHDDWINLTLQIGLVLSPLNPALFWINRSIHQQRELAVDSAVITKTGQPIAYATCLTRLAEQQMQRSRMRLALAAWEQKSELAQRVHALLTQAPAWTRMQSAWATAIAGAVFTVAVSAMAHVPQLVRVVQKPMQAATAQTLLPPVLALPTSTPGALLGGHMSQVVYHMPSATMPKSSRAKRRGAVSVKKANLKTTRNHLVAISNQFLSGPRFRYTAASASTATDMVLTNSAATARTTPAVMYVPLVAVPVSDGWLIINL